MRFKVGQILHINSAKYKHGLINCIIKVTKIEQHEDNEATIVYKHIFGVSNNESNKFHSDSYWANEWCTIISEDSKIVDLLYGNGK